MSEETIIDYRSGREFDSGYFYCPYVPLITSPVIFPELSARLEALKKRRQSLEEVDWVNEGF